MNAFGTVASLTLSMLVTVAASPTAPRAASKNAPGDEYFGRLHMSALRLRINIDQLAARYRARTASDDDLVHDAGDIENAMHLWIARYPGDVWAAPTALHLAQLYTLIQSDPARSAARAAFHYVADTFPGTSFAHQAQLRLAQGFPALQAESPVVPSPAPSTAPVTSGGSPAPLSTDASPIPAASPSTVASPQPHTS